MKQLKPRDKVVQKMTRDGLTLENQTTGEVENISDRAGEPELSAPEVGGTAEKALERADTMNDRHKAKKAAKQATADAREGDAALHRPSSRLQLTEEERADPDMQKYIRKSDKRADKLDKAREQIPHKHTVSKQRIYDEASQKSKTRLHMEQVEKPAPKLKPSPMNRPAQEIGLAVHGKIHEVEHDNVGVESGHKGEELAERQMGKAIRKGMERHKLKPYRAASKAEQKALKANAEYFYQKSLRDNPQMAASAGNPVSRLWQKQRIKRQYAKAARAAGQTAQGAAKAAGTSAKAAKTAARESGRTASFVVRHWKGVLLAGALLLLTALVMGSLQSCTAMFGSAGSGFAATSYLSEDADMLGAEAAYCALEDELQRYLDTYTRTHDYDEYHFDLDTIEHDPYVLISMISALHEGAWTLDEVRGTLQDLFDRQYILTEDVVVEVRYRTVTRTDSEGNDYEVEVPYNYYICYVTLENFNLSHVPVYMMSEEQLSMYALYMSTLGNRPDLFPSSGYIGKYITNRPPEHEVPESYLDDETFAAILKEAEKYLGFPYVWGGSSPSMSFDCSGFVSYVYNQCGWSFGRLGAQGLYNICSRTSSPRPGDLVFFVGTYDTAGISHVGIYVGDGWMLHCGDPISYANLNSSYWQSHLYAYGRLP